MLGQENKKESELIRQERSPATLCSSSCVGCVLVLSCTALFAQKNPITLCKACRAKQLRKALRPAWCM